MRNDQVIDLSERRTPWALLFFLGWTAVVVLMALVLSAQLKTPFPLALLNQGVEFYTLALLSIGVWKVSGRLHGRPRRQWLLGHTLMAVVVIAVWQGASFLYLRWYLGARFWDIVFADSWMFQAVTVVMTYGTMLGVTLAIQSSRRAAQLEIAARDAELLALKAQLHPHFLFNSLNSILELIDADPPRAREMIVRLSELLQSTLRRIDLDRVPLEGEIDLVRAYLAIEKIRFSSRLRVAIDVDRDVAGAGVPPLLLQPIVENAVKHGIAPKPGGGEVRVSARAVDGRLRLEVADSGDGTATPNEGNGRGLELTRRRLEGAYGHDYHIGFDRRAGEFVVSLDLPFAHA